MTRRETREKILQTLFQMDITGVKAEDAIDFIVEEYQVSSEEIGFLENRVYGTFENLKGIDTEISKYLKGWTISRLPYVDRNILRLAAFEMLFAKDLTTGVIVNEAVELAKKFGTDDSAKYINGVLGTLVKENAAIEDKSIKA